MKAIHYSSKYLWKFKYLSYQVQLALDTQSKSLLMHFNYNFKDYIAT